MNDDKKRNTIRISKMMAYLLRHGAVKEGITMDNHGWIAIHDMVEFINSKFKLMTTIDEVKYIVASDNKQRYTIKNGMIRANQGHSIPVDLQLASREPPDILYHGTAQHFLESIMETGLLSMNRHHVHLSKDLETALAVGRRHGSPVVIGIHANKMARQGFTFHLSDNGVWLVNTVPVRFLFLLDDE
ncbi:RNA--NAD 2'-phosphotransferase [Candidatus Bathyarchaeota archaeon]|nr:RNA--NAD 2'-phosphotransferase [Candidatus Bathyarchaeota archaeon]